MPISLVYAWRNVLARKASTAVTTLGVAASVMVFLVMSATADGISRIAVSTGSPRNVVVLSDGATSAEISYLDVRTIQRVRFLPGVARDPTGDTITSVEFLQPRTLRRSANRGVPGAERLVSLRGVTPRALDVHDGVFVETGQLPSGPDQVAIGGVLARKLGISVGDEAWLDEQRVRVTGILDASGQVFAGEVWTELGDLRSRLGQNGASAVVLRAANPERASELIATLDSAAGLAVTGRTEESYYREIQAVSEPFTALANLIGFVLGIGAVLAGMNTLYAAMSRRTRELGTLRALGFGRHFVGGTLLLESVLIGVIGGLLGAALGLCFDGFALSLPGLSFELTVRPATIAQGGGLAVMVGVLGGALPAYTALRLEIIRALRQA